MAPKTNKKQEKAAKQKEAIQEIEIRENAAYIKAVEVELRQKLVGAFKVRSIHVTTKWEGVIQNRAPDLPAIEKLAESLRLIGVRRTQSEHHMLGSLSSHDVKGMLQALKLTKAQVKALNDKSEFPEVPSDWLDDNDVKIQLEAGQHRFLALDKVYPDNEEERWWILKVFEQPLGNVASDHLRANDLFYMTPLSDGERFRHCYDYLKMIDDCTRSDAGQAQKAMYSRTKSDLIFSLQGLLDEELDKLTHQRSRQLWNRADIRNKFKECIAIPGVRQMVTMGSLDTLLRLRMSDVWAQVYDRILLLI